MMMHSSGSLPSKPTSPASKKLSDDATLAKTKYSLAKDPSLPFQIITIKAFNTTSTNYFCQRRKNYLNARPKMKYWKGIYLSGGTDCLIVSEYLRVSTTTFWTVSPTL
jgi:hypothetical protein